MRILIIALILSSCCGAPCHLQKAIRKGAKIYSVLTVKYDTVKLESIRDSIHYKIEEIDTSAILSACKTINVQRASTIRKIQTVACTPFKIDSTYILKVITQDTTMFFKLNVYAYSDANSQVFSIEIPEMRIPVKKEETDIKISASKKYDWIISILLGAGSAIFMGLSMYGLNRLFKK